MLVAPDGLLVLEHARRAPAPDTRRSPVRTRAGDSGDSALSFYELKDSMSTLAVYPGSFDPLTNGHVDIISRGARLFDRIIVAILVNAEKSPMFTMDERVEIAREVFKDHPNVEVDTFDGLLVDYVERKQAQVIVRGLRAVSDFEFEFQMALMNQRLKPQIETVFMMPAEQYTYISSRLIKEVFALGGRVHGLVPELVEQRLREKGLAEGTHEACGPHLAHCRIADDEGGRHRRSAAPVGRRGHRLRRRRTGLLDARRDQGGGARGARRRTSPATRRSPASPT